MTFNTMTAINFELPLGITLLHSAFRLAAHVLEMIPLQRSGRCSGGQPRDTN